MTFNLWASDGFHSFSAPPSSWEFTRLCLASQKVQSQGHLSEPFFWTGSRWPLISVSGSLAREPAQALMDEALCRLPAVAGTLVQSLWRWLCFIPPEAVSNPSWDFHVFSALGIHRVPNNT